MVKKSFSKVILFSMNMLHILGNMKTSMVSFLVIYYSNNVKFKTNIFEYYVHSVTVIS